MRIHRTGRYLTEEIVREIRAGLELGIPGRELARTFRVGSATVCRIKARQWRPRSISAGGLVKEVS